MTVTRRPEVTRIVQSNGCLGGGPKISELYYIVRMHNAPPQCLYEFMYGEIFTPRSICVSHSRRLYAISIDLVRPGGTCPGMPWQCPLGFLLRWVRFHGMFPDLCVIHFFGTYSCKHVLCRGFNRGVFSSVSYCLLIHFTLHVHNNEVTLIDLNDRFDA